MVTRVIRYDRISIREIDTGDQYGKLDVEGISVWVSIWDICQRYGMVYRYGYLPHRYGHPAYRYCMWARDMGDDSIVMVISNIDTGHIVTLSPPLRDPLPSECQ